MVLAEGDTAVRQFRFSREAIRLGIALVLLAVAGVSSAVTGWVGRAEDSRQDARLAVQNRLLRSELGNLTTQIDTLRTSIDQLHRQDDAFRLMAGLEPLDEDIRQVGIGGPDGESLEAQPLYATDRATARRAFANISELNALLRRARLLSFSWREAEDSLRDWNDRMEAMPSILPATGYVSSGFTGSRWHPILDRARPHEGVDITAPVGTPIVAAAKGTVTRAGYEGDFGQMVEIDHGFGVTTRYAHASRTLVKRGQVVKRGDRIALVGATGLANGPHLHYEVLVNGRPANPKNFFMNVSAVRD